MGCYHNTPSFIDLSEPPAQRPSGRASTLGMVGCGFKPPCLVTPKTVKMLPSAPPAWHWGFRVGNGGFDHQVIVANGFSQVSICIYRYYRCVCIQHLSKRTNRTIILNYSKGLKCQLQIYKLCSITCTHTGYFIARYY